MEHCLSESCIGRQTPAVRRIARINHYTHGKDCDLFLVDMRNLAWKEKINWLSQQRFFKNCIYHNFFKEVLFAFLTCIWLIV